MTHRRERGCHRIVFINSITCCVTVNASAESGIRPTAGLRLLFHLILDSSLPKAARHNQPFFSAHSSHDRVFPGASICHSLKETVRSTLWHLSNSWLSCSARLPKSIRISS